MDKLQKIKDLVAILNEASVSYYNTDKIIMTDDEYDKLYEELLQLEDETKYIMSNSPTQKVGAIVISELETVKHNHPMLSLDKCHTVEELIDFAGDRDCLLMLKLDGLTVTLEYNNGKLISAETRGTGEEGTNILHNALVFANIPKEISYKNHLIIDGESIVTYSDFNRINDALEDDKYSNTRSLACGSTTLLDANIAKDRCLRFIGWRVIEGLNEIDNPDSNFYKLKEAERLGFDITPMWTYTNKSSNKENLNDMLSSLRVLAEKLGYPIDGAVMLTDSISLGAKMGRTDKFFRHSIAYKFEDEDFPTDLLDVEFTMGKTGVLTPTAIFKPVLIDGTSVSRASLHNISIMEELDLKKGCTINVYKANCIIPQIRSSELSGNETENINIPKVCPICRSETEVRVSQDSKTKKIVKTLYCTNDNCKGKLLGRLSHFVSKYAMNIDGLGESQLTQFIKLGWITELKDIYNLKNYKSQMIQLDGFGKKSVEKLLLAIESSKNVKLENFIYSLSIPLIGKSASKTISKHCKGDTINFYRMINEKCDFTILNDFGEAMHDSITKWFNNNYETYRSLAAIMKFIKEDTIEASGLLINKSICITGKLIHYQNRDELVADIIANGGKEVSGVTSKTDYLLTNDTTSGSSKNKKATELGIPIISEEDFMKMIGKQ